MNMPSGRAVHRLWLWAVLLTVALAGCSTGGVPITPYPEVVYVPHPLSLPEGPASEDLLEAYSASPNRNPEGLGVLSTIWLNSRMTLFTWQTALAMEERNRLAYARTPEEQTRALDKAHALYREHWVFEGLLLGFISRDVALELYKPEGIYILDDRGRKFYPEVTKDQEVPRYPWQRSPGDPVESSNPRLMFPKDTISAETRAVSLYLAAFGTRLRFTWVFDPDYELPDTPLGPDSGREQNRLFPSP